MIPLPLEVLPALESASLGAPPWNQPTALPATAPPDQSDIVIIGAGITGLAAATSCALAGRRVVVLERAFGTGATARSGGVVLGETVEGPDPEFERCEETLKRWIDEARADCDLRWQGCLELGRDPRLSRTPIDWHDGGSVRAIGRVSGGVLDPARLQVALLAAARDAGVTIANGVAVTNVAQGGGAIQVSTDHGITVAADGIMAVDAMCWRRGFDPWWERVMTVSSQTAPLTSEQLSAIGLRPDEAFYTVDTPLLWGRVMPDTSLLVGRETLPFPQPSASHAVRDGLHAAGARLTRRVRGLHPALTDIVIRRIWTGPLARTAAGHPTIAPDPFVPRLLWAGGYGGQGIAQAFTLGRRAASRIVDGA
jgi:glycine/D-amino acid oxidase-like deaminating enzyme